MSKYLFGDLVHEVKEKVDRQNNPYEFFIAGDHMDTDELHLLRRGTFAGSDVGPAFIRVFKPGQVLYGSRRTYLRKVAVADFEGVTANTTFVLETKNESILIQQLLPFIMQSERFVQHSIKRSKGSTNPYVLFSDLCDYEIDLPNIETQKRLAEVLWTMDEVRMAYKKLIAATDEQVKSQFIENIQPLLDIRETVPLDRLIEPDRPITYGILKPGIETHDGVPVVKVKDIRNGRIDESDLLRTSTEIDHQYRRSRLRNGDLLISIRGTVGRIAEVPKTLENANITQDTARLSIKADYNKTFVRGVLESAPIQRDMEKNIRGVAVKGINIGYLRQLGIPLCKRNVQDTLAQIYVQADKSKFELEQALSELTTTYKRIISEQLG